MFENLSQKLKDSFNKLIGKGVLTNKNLEDTILEVKEALLNADVNLEVVNKFVENIKMKSLGEKITSGVSASQQFVKIINDEIVEMLGSKANDVNSYSHTNVIMLVGLQGSGKTTFAAKLGYFFKKANKKALLVSLDVHRPAAIQQLKILSKNNNIDFFDSELIDLEDRTKEAIKMFRNYKYIIVDTAGRTQNDDSMMNELKIIKNLVKPNEIILVLDSMLGQESLNISKIFNDVISLDSVAITKVDGDSRGGVALNVKSVLQKPIKFVSNGEKIEDIDKFYPDRIASRILGLGDVVSLVEKAQSVISEKKSKEIEDKIRKNKFDLEDFLFQIEALSKMGPLSKLIKLIPGAPKIDNTKLAEQQLFKTKALIQSMTSKEKSNPKVLDFSRKNRIARGSGLTVADLNRMIEQFSQLQKVFAMFKGKF